MRKEGGQCKRGSGEIMENRGNERGRGKGGRNVCVCVCDIDVDGLYGP